MGRTIIGKVGGEFGKMLERAELYSTTSKREETKMAKLKKTEEEVKDKKTKKTKKTEVEEKTPGKKRAEVPSKLYSHPEIGEALTGLRDAEDRAIDGIKYRRQLRNAGFKLSDPSTWEPFLDDSSKKSKKKSKKKKEVEEEEDDD